VTNKVLKVTIIILIGVFVWRGSYWTYIFFRYSANINREKAEWRESDFKPMKIAGVILKVKGFY